MSQNPYEASNAPSASHAGRPFVSAHLLFSALSSAVLLLLGLAISSLSMLPSDAPGFFLLTGLHLIACGMLSAICLLGKSWSLVRHLSCWTSMLLNTALAVRIGMLVFDGTIRGPLIIAAPLLVGVPAAINVVVAVVILRRGGQADT
jgi:hypothetical protein